MRPRLSLALVLLILGASTAANAGNGGRTTIDVTGSFGLFPLVQGPSETLTIQTYNISPLSTGDTVIHVQNADDPSGGFIAGNDDFGGTNASRVVVAPTGALRNLNAIVRAYFQTTSGTCTVQIFSAQRSTQTYDNVSFGGTRLTITTLAAGTHVTTAELQGGSPDTVMLVISGSDSSHAVAFNDDNGVGAMSWVHTAEACPGCQVSVANWAGGGPLKTNVIWDEDADTHDSDGDGLGDGLEQALGMFWTNDFHNQTANTNPPNDPTHKNRDSDQDGIPDNYELLGVEPTSDPTPIKFPLMGSDPMVKDIFIEADWVQCITNCGPLGMDAYRVQGSDAEKYAADLLPGVNVHVDIGLTTSDPTKWFKWNDWGGAQRLTTSGPCDGFTPARKYLFRHFTVLGTAGQGSPGDCYTSDRPERDAVHELGHSLFLMHGGRPQTISLNGKPEYPSIMNYSYQGDPSNAPSFSHGGLPSLNPTSLTERATFVSTALMNKLAGPDWGYKVDVPNGMVDWDRDGEFAPAGTTTRAAISCTPGHFDNSCTFYGASEFGGGIFQDPVLVWQKGIPGGIGDRLDLFGRNSAGVVAYRSALKSTMDAQCGSFSSYDGGYSNCAGMNLTTLSSGPGFMTTAFAPAAASLGTNNVLLIFADSSNKLTSFTLTTSIFGNDTWSQAMPLPGSVVITGAPAAIATSTGVVKVWAPSSGRLKMWTFQNGSWSSANDEIWTDLTFVAPANIGIGVTNGYQDGGATSFVYGAIPVSTPAGQVEFGRRDPTTGQWTNLSGIWSQSGRITTNGRPALTYVQKAGALAQVGRFYLLWMPSQPTFLMQMMLSEGNLTPSPTVTTKRLTWVVSWTPWDHIQGGATAVFDPSEDTNLRASMSNTAGTNRFAPLADGIVNGTVTDMDDWQYLQGAERASLGLEPLPLP